MNLLFFQEALNPKVKIADPKDKTPLPIEEFGKEKAGKVIDSKHYKQKTYSLALQFTWPNNPIITCR